MSDSAPYAAYLVVAAIMLVMVARWVWKMARERRRSRAAESWPTVEATVESFYSVHSTDRDSSYSGTNGFGYLPVLQYSYRVEGERYSGSFNTGVWESNADLARETGQGWVGEKIRIRYKPSDPSISMWLQQDGAPAGTRSTVPYGADDGFIDPELNK